MPHRMLVESDPHRSRVALLEDDRLVEILVEPRFGRGAVGNVYKGRVTRVLPGIQAAFLDIGCERDAFLYVSEATGGVLDLEDEDGGGAEARPAAPAITDLLESGQELLVQVIKDELASKGARVSAQITLPGRFLVLLPGMSHCGVSRRIRDDAERQRLRDTLGQLLGPAPAEGVIVRTAGAGRAAEDFAADLDELRAAWERIGKAAAERRAPALVQPELDLPLRAVRDLFSPQFAELWVEGEEDCRRIEAYLGRLEPALRDRLRPYRGEAPLFERFGIEDEIAAALRSKVWLKSGGYLVINPTEALVAIDVNSGRYVGRSNLEDTVLRLNLEAVEEIVRQIRLRDLAGILVVDFIDMVDPAHREQVFEALLRELEKDRAKNKVLGISDFGLVEITRRRSRANLQSLLTQPCPYCEGSGRIRSLASICLGLRRELLRRRQELDGRQVVVRVHPEVSRALEGEQRAVLEELERALGRELVLETTREVHPEHFEIVRRVS